MSNEQFRKCEKGCTKNNYFFLTDSKSPCWLNHQHLNFKAFLLYHRIVKSVINSYAVIQYNYVMSKIFAFIKKRIVFCVSFLLAVISCFIVPPSKDYISYIDWNTLAILFALMSAIQGLNSCGVFKSFGRFLCSKCGSTKSLCTLLIFMCFFTSMLITNDVALLTFVPFALILLGSIEGVASWVPMYTVILQTVAANTGSMLTPVGNPQNLFLYEQTGMALGEFILILLPYTLLCGGLLLICCLFIPSVKLSTANAEEEKSAKPKLNLILHTALFVLCLLSVARFVPKLITAAVALLLLLIFDRDTLGKVDYFLLLTFVCFFIFSGNLSNISVVRTFLQNSLAGRECLTSALVSQVVSNVPATLMLYPFAQDLRELLLGVNFGGLGTLVGSLASLISFNIYGQFKSESTGKFLGLFTIINVIFLVILFIVHL